MSGERPVGLFSMGGRHAIAQRGIHKASGMVMQREQTVVSAKPGDRWMFVVPVIGSKVVVGGYLGMGEGMLATENRVGGRLKHTISEGWTRLDMGAIFGRFRVNSLNLNGELPWHERALLSIQSSKGLEDIENTPVLGGAVKFAQGVLTPFLKVFTRDSWRAKIISFPGNWIIGAAGGAVSETLLGSYLGGPLISSSKFENGLDAGDQVADLATMASYLEYMQNPHVSDGRKRKIARAFLDHYDQPPTGREVARHQRGLKRHPIAEAGHQAVAKGAQVVREIGQYVDIPFSGLLVGAARLTRGSDPANPPRSMHDSVDHVLQVAQTTMGELRTTIAAAGRLRRVGVVDAEVALATWEYRLRVATLLNAVYTEARTHEPEYRSRFLPRARRGQAN